MTAPVESSTQTGVPGCPNKETLQQFLTGQLSEANAENIERHLESCVPCLGRLGEFSSQGLRLNYGGSWGLELATGPQPHTVTSLIHRLCRPPGKPAADIAGDASKTTSGTFDAPLDIDPPAVSRDVPPNPPRFGRYQVLRAIGAGGMGAVYLAADPELGRFVAVKVPQFSGPPESQANARQRFMREARAAAAVRHPRVCPIYDVGEQDGTPYVVMAFIEGCSLAQRLKSEGPFADPRAAVALAIQIADSLAAVHDSGLIHRDLKPANVLLDSAGDVFLSDFGLARRPDDGDRLTTFGTLIGTLAYMAPEQAETRGSFGPLTPRTDLYSLGVVLYEMLTGRLPFKADSDASLLYQIIYDTPLSPRQLRADLGPDLEAIVVRAMARQPWERFANAREFAAALATYLQVAPQPVVVTPAFVSDTTQLELRPQRRQRLTLWKAAVGLMSAALLLLAVFLFLKPRYNNGADAHDGEQPGVLLKAAPALLPIKPPKSPRPGVNVIKDHSDTVRAVAMSSDGKLVATAGDDKSIRIWDLATGKRKERIPHPAEVYCLAFSPTRDALAWAGTDGAITLWNLTSGEKQKTIANVNAGKVAWLAFAPPGRVLAAVGYQKKVAVLWDLDEGKQLVTLEGHTAYVNAAAFSPDSKTVATVSDDRTVKLWDSFTGKAKTTLVAHDRPVHCLAFSPDGGKLATGSGDKTVVIWDVATGKATKPVLEDQSSVVFVGWTPDLRIVSKTYRDGVSLWDPAATKPVVIRKDFDKPLVSVGRSYHADVALSPDGSVLAFRDCYWTQTVHVLDLAKYLDGPK